MFCYIDFIKLICVLIKWVILIYVASWIGFYDIEFIEFIKWMSLLSDWKPQKKEEELKLGEGRFCFSTNTKR